MFSRLLLFVSFFQLLAQNNSEAICPLGTNWELDKSFSDEFNSIKLNYRIWWDFNPAWLGRKPALFMRSNVKVKNGTLQLTAKALDRNEISLENKTRGFDKFSTAIVKSKKRSHYGYYELRAKTMAAGVCNAFWLYDPLDESDKYIDGEYSEEIDIFEVFGRASKRENQRAYYAAVHRYETPYVESIVNKKKFKLKNRYKKLEVPFEFHSDFHIFGFLWTPSELIWYLDGAEVFRRENDYFNRPLYIILDAEIMEKWDGLPQEIDLPSIFYIDYLRVWRKL